jgi:hypothetical protein
MPPKGINSLFDRGQFLYQIVHQHAVSPVHQFITALIIPHRREKSIIINDIIINGMHCAVNNGAAGEDKDSQKDDLSTGRQYYTG